MEIISAVSLCGMQPMILLLLLIIPLEAFTQDSLFFLHDSPPKGLHTLQGRRFALSERTIGIVGELQGVKPFFASIGIAQGYFKYGEGTAGGTGFTAAFDFAPGKQLYGPRLSAWTGGMVYFFGIGFRASAIYYITASDPRLVIRPEAGINLVKLNINYGYNLAKKRSEAGIPAHMIGISYYQNIYPLRKRARKE